MATAILILIVKKESEDRQPISQDITNVRMKTVQNLMGKRFVNLVLKEVSTNTLNLSILIFSKLSTFLTQ